jgi:hypothetical protein
MQRTNEHGGGEGEAEKVFERVPVPVLQEHHQTHGTTHFHETRARLHADLLVYGWIGMDGDRWG